MRILINPGTGPVDWKETLAHVAAESFRTDIGLAGVQVVPTGSDGDGRWDFRFTSPLGACEVSMPGVPVDVLKGDILRAPRLYVDGNSWWWKYALNIARGILSGKEDSDD